MASQTFRILSVFHQCSSVASPVLAIRAWGLFQEEREILANPAPCPDRLFQSRHRLPYRVAPRTFVAGTHGAHARPHFAARNEGVVEAALGLGTRGLVR